MNKLDISDDYIIVDKKAIKDFCRMSEKDYHSPGLSKMTD